MPVSGLVTAKSNIVLDAIFNAGALTPPASFYVALFTTAPSFTGGGVEVVGGDYARQVVTDWAAAVERQVVNVVEIEFPQASESWGRVVAAALFDAATDGAMWAFGTLSQPIDIPVGAVRRFPAGSLRFRIN